MGFCSRPQLIGTGSTGLVFSRLNLAGGAKEDEQRQPAFSAVLVLSPWGKKLTLGAIISSQHRGKKSWRLQGLGKEERSCLG